MQFASIQGPILLPAPVWRTHRTNLAMNYRAPKSESLNRFDRRHDGPAPTRS